MKSAVVLVHKLTDAEAERLCSRQDVVKDDAAVKDRLLAGIPNFRNPPEVMNIKSEVPEAKLEFITVKEEPIDLHQELQANSSAASSSFTFKREACNFGAEARSGNAEAEDKLREDSSVACSTSSVLRKSAGASQGSTDSLSSDVFGRVRCGNLLNCTSHQAARFGQERVGRVSFERKCPEVLLPALSVAAKRWTIEQRAFAVEAYFSNGHSIIATKRAFRTRFNIRPAGPVPGRQSIVTWVDTFRASGSLMKSGCGGRPSVTTPKNVKRGR